LSLQVGRKQRLRDVNISITEPLMPPAELLSELPLEGQAEETVVKGRKGIQDVLDGADDRFVIITGPCSIHDYDAAIEYAGRLGALADRTADRILMVMRVYFEKPRTTVGWKGAIYDPHLDGSFDITTGLRRARSLLLEVARMGLFAATEFLDPIVPQYTADLVSWAAIGARTAESQTHRQMASGLSMPIGFKNGTGGSVQLAVDGVVASQATHGFLGIDMNGQASAIQTTGNPYSHTVLRGSTRGTNYDAASVEDAQQKLEAAGLAPRLVVDCSHANCAKDHTKMRLAFIDVVEQRAAGNQGLVGCMLESNINPGNQNLNGGAEGLEYGVSITDPCIGWDETEELISWAYDRLGSAA
jgi:3-deoxy-7-phosphoheptulonate synthase